MVTEQQIEERQGEQQAIGLVTPWVLVHLVQTPVPKCNVVKQSPNGVKFAPMGNCFALDSDPVGYFAVLDSFPMGNCFPLGSDPVGYFSPLGSNPVGTGTNAPFAIT